MLVERSVWRQASVSRTARFGSLEAKSGVYGDVLKCRDTQGGCGIYERIIFTPENKNQNLDDRKHVRVE